MAVALILNDAPRDGLRREPAAGPPWVPELWQVTDGRLYMAEYKANVAASALSWGDQSLLNDQPELFGSSTREALANKSVPDDWLEELEAMDPAERRLILDELAARPDLWDEEEVAYEF